MLTIFDHDADSPLRMALNESGIKLISDFIAMLPHDIEALTYTHSISNADGTDATFTSTLPLQTIYKGHVKILQGYNIYRTNTGDPIKDNWTSITRKQLETYMVSNHLKVYYMRTRVPLCHDKQHHHDLHYGEPKETNENTLSDDPLIPCPYHADLDTRHMCFNSPCGEINQSVNLMPTSNNNLQQSETPATTSSNTNTLRIPRTDIHRQPRLFS